jgi:beta-lactamase class A
MDGALSRRAVLGFSLAGAGTLTLHGSPRVARAQGTIGRESADGLDRIKQTYLRETQRAGGTWYSLITALGADGAMVRVVEERIDQVVAGYSVQKMAVALAVMDKVDHGELSLDQRQLLTADTVASGSGIYQLQTVYGDELTLANVLVAMLLMSDNTAVRLCGKLVSGPEINAILAGKGFPQTQVEPLPGNSHRFFLGNTTAREMHDLWLRLANQKLLSAQSTQFLLGITRWVNGYMDGVRRNMSSDERSRVAIKYGALGDSRHETGVIFDTTGAPALVFTLFNTGLGGTDNFGATNPGVQAEAVLGRVMLDVVDSSGDPPSPIHAPVRKFSPSAEAPA